MFLKVVSAISSATLNSKILIVSGAPIWVIFQNSVTYVCLYKQCLLVVSTFADCTAFIADDG